jgi:hypothetical protein
MLLIEKIEKFEQFHAALEALPHKDQYGRDDLINEKFLLFSESNLNAYYVPFHYLNRRARVILVGLTPRWTQMERAFRAAKCGMINGLKDGRLYNFVNTCGSFSGSMRPILEGMLDGIGLHKCLGIDSCSDLFAEASELVHFTSVVSAPIFKDGENYTASNARQLLTLPLFRSFILNNFAKELDSLAGAVMVPLGKVADEVIAFLGRENLIRGDRTLMGFPHPSGANGHRKPQFEAGRARWTEQLATLFRD